MDHEHLWQDWQNIQNLIEVRGCTVAGCVMMQMRGLPIRVPIQYIEPRHDGDKP